MAHAPKNATIEREYARKLRKVAAHVADIVDMFDPGSNPDNEPAVQEALAKYADTIRGWAWIAGDRMVQSTVRSDIRRWEEMTQGMGAQVRRMVASADMRPTVDRLRQEQMDLITSIPTGAADRVHDLTTRALSTGARASEIAKEIRETGEVTKSRATLIARTEVQRSRTFITEQRATAIGSTEYIWRTAGDADVRPGHREMANKVCQWNSPPAVDEGSPGKPRIMHHHPGCIWNCRCYPEPIIPE